MAKFYICPHCGTTVGMIKEAAIPVCCGETMKEMEAKSIAEEGNEKHVPLVHEEDGKVYVKVGSVLHPMDQDHYIDWVYLLTDKGAQRKILRPGEKPEVVFLIDDEEVVLSVMAHCNKHGLWKADI